MFYTYLGCVYLYKHVIKSVNGNFSICSFFSVTVFVKKSYNGLLFSYIVLLDSFRIDKNPIKPRYVLLEVFSYKIFYLTLKRLIKLGNL